MTKRIGSNLVRGGKLREADVKRMFGEKAAQKAAEMYRMWHQKHPDGFGAAEYDEPSRFQQLGHVVHGSYYSDKWEEDGRGYLYVHDFTSKPALYGDEVMAECVIKGDRKRGKAVFKPSADVLRCDLQEPVVLAFMCMFKTLTVMDGTTKVDVDLTAENAPAFCLPDKKGILVFVGTDEPACLVIRGGKMVVTDRGIVH